MKKNTNQKPATRRPTIKEMSPAVDRLIRKSQALITLFVREEGKPGCSVLALNLTDQRALKVAEGRMGMTEARISAEISRSVKAGGIPLACFSVPDALALQLIHEHEPTRQLRAGVINVVLFSHNALTHYGIRE